MYQHTFSQAFQLKHLSTFEKLVTDAIITYCEKKAGVSADPTIVIPGDHHHIAEMNKYGGPRELKTLITADDFDLSSAEAKQAEPLNKMRLAVAMLHSFQRLTNPFRWILQTRESASDNKAFIQYLVNVKAIAVQARSILSKLKHSGAVEEVGSSEEIYKTIQKLCEDKIEFWLYATEQKYLYKVKLTEAEYAALNEKSFFYDKQGIAITSGHALLGSAKVVGFGIAAVAGALFDGALNLVGGTGNHPLPYSSGAAEGVYYSFQDAKHSSTEAATRQSGFYCRENFSASQIEGCIQIVDLKPFLLERPHLKIPLQINPSYAPSPLHLKTLYILDPRDNLSERGTNFQDLGKSTNPKGKVIFFKDLNRAKSFVEENDLDLCFDSILGWHLKNVWGVEERLAGHERVSANAFPDKVLNVKAEEKEFDAAAGTPFWQARKPQAWELENPFDPAAYAPKQGAAAVARDEEEDFTPSHNKISF